MQVAAPLSVRSGGVVMPSVFVHVESLSCFPPSLNSLYEVVTLVQCESV